MHIAHDALHLADEVVDPGGNLAQLIVARGGQPFGQVTLPQMYKFLKDPSQPSLQHC